ncbi:MAG: DUF411 domain-containing protein [Burkholderiales bacterium]|nr:DUF411 domain-containing protein [Burkholderiales bacterium]
MKRRALLLSAAMLPVAAATASKLPVVEVWKSPSCGCCKLWVEVLERDGFVVKVYDTGNNAMRGKLRIPAALGSCHTARVGGYAIEGHVPPADIRRLLRERPMAIGLAVPGMPIGSPGMDGPDYDNQQDPYDVLLVQADGSTRVFNHHPGRK